ncbi:MAG: hypothetical protein NTV19_16050 [Burkholderiales bacterium]|nr:hypothetical protein [Burkholderiales bacterium]
MDKRIRQALAQTVDREALVRVVYGRTAGWAGNDSHRVAADATAIAGLRGRSVATTLGLIIAGLMAAAEGRRRFE